MHMQGIVTTTIFREISVLFAVSGISSDKSNLKNQISTTGYNFMPNFLGFFIGSNIWFAFPRFVRIYHGRIIYSIIAVIMYKCNVL